MQNTSAGYQTEEAKSVGAIPNVYVAMMRTTKSLVSADFSAGVHTNTEFTNSKLGLAAGQTSGNWVSVVLDSAHLTPNVIFDKITWSETLNSGTIVVQIRTATTSGGVAAASYATYTSGTLDHTSRHRYYQVKISITSAAAVDSEQGTVRISTVDGQAFLWDTGQDFTAYVGDGSDNLYSVKVKDAENDAAYAYCGAESAGESLGSELHDDSNAAADPNSSEADATTGWGNDPTGGTIASDSTDPNVGTYHFDINATGDGEGGIADAGTIPTAIGKLYKLTCDVKVISGTFTIDIRDSGDTATVKTLETTVSDAAYTSKTYYWTALGTNERIRIIGDSGGAAQIYVDNLSVKEVTDPPADVGLKLYSAQDGNTQNLKSKDAGFDQNDTLTYNIYKTPTITTVKIRHKALIPTTNYKNLGTISYGIDVDFNEAHAGNVSIVVDNKSHQFEKYQATSYIYEIDYYFEFLEIWAGFSVSGTVEWLCQFIGEITNIEVNSGQGADYNATIQARDYLYRKLVNTLIGRPSSAGTPQPYMSGIRYRVPCKETDSDNYIYTFYCQQTITSIDAVYIRDTNNQKWVTAPSNTPSAVAKTVTFDADPESEVSVDITVNTTDHPIDIIEDILVNELELDSDYYDSTSMDTTKDRTNDLAVGVCFENMNVYEAFKHLIKALDGCMYIENGQFKCKNYWPTLTTTQDFDEDVHRGININDSVFEVQNKISVFYGDYEDDKTKYFEAIDQDSIDDYGELTKENFYFRYNDPVSITDNVILQEIIGHWLFRQQYQYEFYRFNLRLEILRAEIFDIVTLTSTKHNLSAALILLAENIDLTSYTGNMEAIRYPEISWMFFSDDADVDDLYYFVDDADSDLDYQSYFW